MRPARRAALVAARLTAPARTWARNSAGVAAYGVSDHVRPMSIPAWSSVPPMPGAAMRLDVDRRRRVELRVARAVADLPDPEQLGEPAAVARGQGRRDRVERMGERAGDLVLVQVGGDELHVVAVRLEPLVVAGRDAEAEDVDLLRLAAERDGQLLGDEHVGAVGDREDPVDRVVVRDRHEVHPARLASAWTSSGGVAHSGRPRALWTPSLATADAEEWQCRSTRLVVSMSVCIIEHKTPLQRAAFVTVREPPVTAM